MGMNIRWVNSANVGKTSADIFTFVENNISPRFESFKMQIRNMQASKFFQLDTSIAPKSNSLNIEGL